MTARYKKLFSNIGCILLLTGGLLTTNSSTVFADETSDISQSDLSRLESMGNLTKVRTSDPLYPLIHVIIGLQDNVDKTILQAEQAEQLASDAKVAAKKASFAASVSNIKYRHSNRILNQWAASLYTTSGWGSPDLVELIATSLANPSDVNDTHKWLEQANILKQKQIINTAVLKKLADEQVIKADSAAKSAAAAAKIAVTKRDLANEALLAAQIELNTILGQQLDHQMIVGATGCPIRVPDNTIRASRYINFVKLCEDSVAQASTPQAALAIKYAFRALGAPYACDSIGREAAFMYDCSSLVMRAYSVGAGLSSMYKKRIPSTQQLVPWHGGNLAPWALDTAPDEAKPGDLVLYDTGMAISRHVVMLLADNMMIHTSMCGDVVNVTNFWGFKTTFKGKYLGTRHIDPDKAQDPNWSFTQNPNNEIIGDAGTAVEIPIELPVIGD